MTKKNNIYPGILLFTNKRSYLKGAFQGGDPCGAKEPVLRQIFEAWSHIHLAPPKFLSLEPNVLLLHQTFELNPGRIFNVEKIPGKFHQNITFQI